VRNPVTATHDLAETETRRPQRSRPPVNAPIWQSATGANGSPATGRAEKRGHPKLPVAVSGGER
jgi:hypothetical protein